MVCEIWSYKNEAFKSKLATSKIFYLTAFKLLCDGNPNLKERKKENEEQEKKT